MGRCVSGFITLPALAHLFEPRLAQNWGADEELRLLSGLERSGIDNWDVVARHVATGKTPRECEAHYECVYLSKSRLGATADDDSLLTPEEEEHQRMAYR